MISTSRAVLPTIRAFVPGEGTRSWKAALASVVMLGSSLSPALADGPYFGYGHGYSHGNPRVEHRVRPGPRFRGCGPRARAHGWCHGHPIVTEAPPQHRIRPAKPHKRPHVREDNDDDLAIALGIVGIAAGALIAGSLAADAQPRQPDPRFDGDPRFVPQPGYRGDDAPFAGPQDYGYAAPDGFIDDDTFPEAPNAVPGAPSTTPDRSYGTASDDRSAPAIDPYTPWSQAWLDACKARYRSFNPSTGTYRTYGGEDRFCVPG